MKKILIFLMSSIMIMLLNSCKTTVNDEYEVDYSNYNSTNLTTLHLVDENGYTYEGIPYICDSMRNWSKTAPNGEFSFVEPDTCIFDFQGLAGMYGDGSDNVVRIVDYTYDGKGGIGYECASFGASTTYGDGSFYYNRDDACEFYL